MILNRPLPRTGWQLRAYLWVSHLIAAIGPRHLRKRLAKGREDPLRWREKLGEPSLPRPDGRLVWLHAVGVGEVMALRGLIGAMAKLAPDLNFLITSSARSSAQVVGGNLPPRTIHQYLPLDAPRYIARFLGHWRPDLSVWAEQDLWPGAVTATHSRRIPLALVGARMNSDAFKRRRRFARLYGDLLSRFSIVTVQDNMSATHLGSLCPGLELRVSGSLKSAAPALSYNQAEFASAGAALRGRRLWLAASTHAEDEVAVFAAQVALTRHEPASLLILVPRDLARREEILLAARASGLGVATRSKGEVPEAEHQVWLADTYGELGLWYRLAPVSLIGGSFGPVEGHNPWEPAALGSAILHGPRVANFAADYAALDAASAAQPVSAATLADFVSAPDLAKMAARAKAMSDHAKDSVMPLARDLLALMPERAA